MDKKEKLNSNPDMNHSETFDDLYFEAYRFPEVIMLKYIYDEPLSSTEAHAVNSILAHNVFFIDRIDETRLYISDLGLDTIEKYYDEKIRFAASYKSALRKGIASVIEEKQDKLYRLKSTAKLKSQRGPKPNYSPSKKSKRNKKDTSVEDLKSRFRRDRITTRMLALIYAHFENEDEKEIRERLIRLAKKLGFPAFKLGPKIEKEITTYEISWDDEIIPTRRYW